MFYLALILSLYCFGCQGSEINGNWINRKEPSYKIPNPYGVGWWVCAYCGKKYENGETSCPCH